MGHQKYPPPRVIAIDVDGTLFGKNGINNAVREFAIKQKQKGFDIILWSMRGEDHARHAAQAAEMTCVFDHIISKPGYILDDKGWDWIRFTQVISKI